MNNGNIYNSYIVLTIQNVSDENKEVERQFKGIVSCDK